jgi:methylamine dehydrogenase accessory protein MauD
MWISALVALWVLVLFMAFLLAGALRQIGLIQLRLGDDPGTLITDVGLDRGVVAPDYAAVDADSGEPHRLSDLAERARVLVFVSPTCVACTQMIPGLNETLASRGSEFDFRVICRGDLESCRAFKRMNALRAPMDVDTTGEVERAYQVTLSPLAYLLDYRRRVLMRGIANDWRQFEALLDQEGTLQGGRPWTPVEADGEGSASRTAEEPISGGTR